MKHCKIALTAAFMILFGFTSFGQKQYHVYRNQYNYADGLVLCGDTLIYKYVTDGGVLFSLLYIGTYSWHGDTLMTEKDCTKKYFTVIKESPCHPDSMNILIHHPTLYPYLSPVSIIFSKDENIECNDTVILTKKTKEYSSSTLYSLGAREITKIKRIVGVNATISIVDSPYPEQAIIHLQPGIQYELFQTLDDFYYSPLSENGDTSRILQWIYDKRKDTFRFISDDDNGYRVYNKYCDAGHYTDETTLNILETARFLACMTNHRPTKMIQNLLVRIREGRP